MGLGRAPAGLAAPAVWARLGPGRQARVVWSVRNRPGLVVGPLESGKEGETPASPDSTPTQRPWIGLDKLGFSQAIGGAILGLVALFSSYDHLTLAGRPIPLPQQWGIPCIAASVATVFIDAELATRARDRDRDLAREEKTEQIRSETEQLRIETEQLKRENARLRQLNAKGDALLNCIDQLCFPPDSNSTPQPPTEPDCGPSSP
jgi:hypothetical protein